MYKNFEEFNRKIHPYWGQGKYANYTKNSKLCSFIIEREEKKENKQECDGNCYECFIKDECEVNRGKEGE